jgi:Flp pilus assembly pilin Flp
MQVLKTLRHFWNDERGMAISGEIILVGSILLLGSIVGLSAFRDHIVTEFTDIGSAVEAVDSSYSVSISGTSSGQVSFQNNASGIVITGNFGTGPLPTVTASVNNFSYVDNSDWCANTAPTWSSNVGNEATPPTAPATFP